MKLGKKILIACIAVVLFFVIEYVLYYVFHYVMFDDYKDTLTSYTVKNASDYNPIGSGSGDLEGYDLVAENDTLKLYVQTTTGYIAVYDSKTDEITYSNPVGIDSDGIANETNKGKLRSQMIVTFLKEDRTEGVYNTYDQCVNVNTNQLTAQSIDGGVRLTYELKPTPFSYEIIPYVLTAERYEYFTSLMTDSKNVKNMEKYYSQAEEGGDYLLKEGIRGSTSATRQADQIKKALYDDAGYTTEDYIADMENSGYDAIITEQFKISMDLTLDGDSLVVEVPTSLITELGGAIENIELLPFFAAAGTDEKGYTVLPNGSGSIINFDAVRDNSTYQYYSYVYGLDPLSADYTVVENTSAVRLPLYAICRENSSVLAVVEDGASLAAIRSVVSGVLSSYDATRFIFTLRGTEKLAMFGTAGNAASIPIAEADFYDVNLKVSYSFLGEDYKGYSGVANYYRERLIAENKLTALGDASSKDAQDIGFYYDVIGAVKATDFMVGVRYLAVTPMTTFNQAKQMAQELKDAGVSNQIVNYQGWFNGGYYHDVAYRVKLVRKLGSEKKFEELAALLESYGGKLYADVAFQKVTYISKKYNSFYESARYYAGYAGTLGQINPATLRQTSSLGYSETLYSLVSPKYLVRYVDKFLDKAAKYDVTGYSLRDLGDVLVADKKRTEVINREESLDVVMAQLAKFAADEKDVMVSGGNSYAVAYADDIINVPTGHNNYFSVDAEIPLYEMIYHGTVDYASEAINLNDNYDIDDITLRLIEYGASPHFTFSYEEANDMKYTGLNSLYAITFANWKDTAVTVYNNVNTALKYVKNATVKEHEIVDDGLKKITYSNGVIFYINETDENATIDGVNVAAMSYEMGGLN
ncbi:MAG: hypothetical protein K6F92_07560 [Lachnospiraceae bacterium]|nr:hypothetical protein [Lachnospiraceae bacterium]